MKDNTLSNTLILLPVYWLFSGMLVMNSGDKPMVAITLISIIVTLFSYGLTSAKANIRHDKTLWLILTMTGYALFSYHYHGLSSREIRALLTASLFLLFFPKQLLTIAKLQILALIGSIFALGTTYYFNQYLGIDRGLWPINAIPLATMSAAFGLISVTLLFTAPRTKKNIAITLLAILFSSGAVLFSQTRGIWLGYTIVTGIVAITLNRGKVLNIKAIAIAVALLSVTGFSLKPVISERLAQTQYEINRILSGHLNTSIGLRLQMWMLSPEMLRNDWVLGLGNDHVTKFKELTAEGQVSSDLAGFKPAHYHNQYIDRSIKNGIVGLAILLALLIFPVYSSMKLSRDRRFILLSISLLYAIASLTDVPFNHTQTLLLYLIVISSVNMQPATEKITLL
ncbi:O-antigen ligase family protein [Photobacterium nomapromontoriensis]|uniref:O-antigen ligase family protein n=1 Tax=Photobacterium nomapromontoriensis TaxID=2910237 RepID=UPI003D0DFC38